MTARYFIFFMHAITVELLQTHAYLVRLFFLSVFFMRIELKDTLPTKNEK